MYIHTCILCTYYTIWYIALPFCHYHSHSHYYPSPLWVTTTATLTTTTLTVRILLLPFPQVSSVVLVPLPLQLDDHYHYHRSSTIYITSPTLAVSCQEPVALPEQDEEVGHTWGGRARARRRRDRIGTTERGEETRCGEKKGNITCDKESRNVTSSWWAGASWEDDVGIWVGSLLPCNILEVSMSQCNSVHASS